MGWGSGKESFVRRLTSVGKDKIVVESVDQDDESDRTLSHRKDGPARPSTISSMGWPALPLLADAGGRFSRERMVAPTSTNLTSCFKHVRPRRGMSRPKARTNDLPESAYMTP